MPADPQFLFAALRGASRAYGKKEFGANIAMTWYGGARWDPLWFKRWKLVLYFAYLAGADFIYSEGGHFGFHGLGNKYGVNSKPVKRFRKILRNFYHFCQNHHRPENGPLVKIGFLQGNLDGCPGLWSKRVWGQFGSRKWQQQAPEAGWEHLEDVYHKEPWFANTLAGEKDFSGQPPYGQYDIVPIESSIEVLSRYSCLILLGWNTMNSNIYRKLKIYVENGGHLIMALPHLSAHLKREEDLRLYKNGNYQDLFGVKVKGKGKDVIAGIKFITDSSLKNYSFPNWSPVCDPKFINTGIPSANIELAGAKVLAVSASQFEPEKERKKSCPILVENRCGKGIAFLITSWCYPGERSMNLFMKELLKTAMIGEQGDLKVIGSDKIRYAVYEENKKKTIYILNTDFDVKSECQVLTKNKTMTFLVEPTELKIINL